MASHRMDPEVRKDKIEWIRGLLYSTEQDGFSQCPKCECGDIVKFGKTRKGSARYRCKGCGRTFTASGVISRSRLSNSQWMQFTECYVDGQSLEKIACRCDVSKSTACRMKSVVDELKHEALKREYHDPIEKEVVFALRTPYSFQGRV